MQRVAGVMWTEQIEGDKERVVRVWKTATGEVEHELRGHNEPVTMLAFSPDGRWLASAGQGKIGDDKTPNLFIWDLTTGKLAHKLVCESTFRIDDNPVSTIAFHPDGKRLAVAVFGGKIALWDLPTGKLQREMQAPERLYVRPLAFDPPGKRLAAGLGLAGAGIRVFDVDDGSLIQPAGALAETLMSSALIAPDGKSVFASCENVMQLRDTATGKAVRSFDGIWLGPLAWSANGKVVLALDLNQVGAFDTRTGKRLWELPFDEIRQGRVIGARELFTFSKTGEVRVRDLTTGKLLETWPGAVARKRLGEERIVAFSINRRFVATRATRQKTVQVRTWGDGDVVCRLLFDGLPDDQPTFEFSLDGGLLMVDHVSGGSRVWSVPDGVERLRFKDWAIGSFSSDGEHLVANGVSRLLAWHVRAGKAAAIQGDPKYVDWFVRDLTADGTVVVLGTYVQTPLLLHEVATGRELGRIPLHPGGCRSASFSPDGRTLLTIGFDGTGLLWDVTGLATTPGQLPLIKRSTAELDKFWDDLTSDDGPRTHKALWALVASGDKAVALLRARVKPVTTDPKRIGPLLTDLAGASLEKRQAAMRQLETLEEARADLARLLADKPALEMRLRIEQILAKLEERAALPAMLHALRGVRVAEQVGSPEARKLLQEWADGVADAHLTRAARRAITRMDDKSAP
jgi:WD40 repeat protein